MVCTRKTKTLVSTCVILSGMTNIICLLYVGWVTNYIASVYVRGQEPAPDKKLEEDKGDTLKIIERLDHLENVIKQHIQGKGAPGNLGGSQGPGVPSAARGMLGRVRMEPAAAGSEAADAWGAGGECALACVGDPRCPLRRALLPGTRVCAGLHARVCAAHWRCGGALRTCPNVPETPGWWLAGFRDHTEVRLRVCVRECLCVYRRERARAVELIWPL